MMRSPRLVRMTAAAAAVLVIPLLPAAAAAPVAGPVAGADYQGRIAGAPNSESHVTFTVSDDGKSVIGTNVGPYPMTLECGSGGDPPLQSSKPAKIRNDRFTAHVVYRAEDNSLVGRATVTGKFLRKGKEKGVVTTVVAATPNCPSHSLDYTAHAK